MRSLVLDIGFRLINPSKPQLINLSNIVAIGSDKMYANYTLRDGTSRLNMFIFDPIEFLNFNQTKLGVDYYKMEMKDLIKIYRYKDN
jgi:hypothetical protein